MYQPVQATFKLYGLSQVIVLSKKGPCFITLERRPGCEQRICTGHGSDDCELPDESAWFCHIFSFKHTR